MKFKIGQRVWSHRFGWGIVCGESSSYVDKGDEVLQVVEFITVDFFDGDIEKYTECGRIEIDDLYPSLFLEEWTEVKK